MATRADNGEGSCKQVKEGRHTGRWRVQYAIEADGAKKRLSRLFPTQREGKDFLRSLKKSDDKAAYAAAKETTFGEWFEWLAANDWPDSLDGKTIRDRLARYRRYAAARWQHVPLSMIDPLDVKSFYKDLQLSGVGEHTCIALRNNLVRAFNLAITPYRRVPHFMGNPFCLPMSVPKRREAVALTPAEAAKALNSPKLDDSRRGILGVYLLAGLRLGEQMALTAGQVRSVLGLIAVDRAVKLSATSAQTVGLPKGGKVRAAVLCDALNAILAPLIEGKPDDELLWPAASGNQPRMKKLAYATWRTIVKDSGLPDAMSPHDCRLTHINWIEKLCPDVSATTLKEHVGHAAEGVTEVNYTRPLAPAQNVLRQNLDRLVTGRSPS